MNRRITVIALCTFLTFGLTSALNAFPQQNNPPQSPPGDTVEKAFEGTLTKVDLAAKLITVKGENDKEMMFVYNNETQMTGIENSPQGLATKTTQRLKVSYRENRGINLALKIEATTTDTRP
jgi:hypothetical protein